MRIIKLHLGFIKFLNKELFKKRTKKEFIYFIKSVIVAYGKALKQYIKDKLNLLDPNFRKQQIEYKKYQQVMSDLQRALKLLNYIDDKMDKSGMNRQQRKQFWNDFIKSRQIRKDVLTDLMRNMR